MIGVSVNLTTSLITSHLTLRHASVVENDDETDSVNVRQARSDRTKQSVSRILRTNVGKTDCPKRRLSLYVMYIGPLTLTTSVSFRLSSISCLFGLYLSF